MNDQPVFIVGTMSDDSFSFPMAEYHCRFTVETCPQTLVYRHPANPMYLLIARDAIRSVCPELRPKLQCLYFPYARQDRVTSPGEPLSCRVFADLLNAQDFAEVLVADPHSDVVAALVERIRVIEQHEIAIRAVNCLHPTVLVSPDAGATKKIQKLSDRTGLPILQCGKKRDTATGKLSGFWMHHEEQDLSVPLIVDDICDGGGTFIGLADVLKQAGSGAPSLYVTHGGFTKGGVKPLLKYFQHIFVSDSMPQDERFANLYIIKLQGIQHG